MFRRIIASAARPRKSGVGTRLPLVAPWSSTLALPQNTNPTAGFRSKSWIWYSSLRGSQRSSLSRKAISSPRAARSPAFRAEELPRFS